MKFAILWNKWINDPLLLQSPRVMNILISVLLPWANCQRHLLVPIISLKEFPRGKSASFFRFDPKIFNEDSWPMLKDVLMKVGCVSGCRLAVSHVAFRKTCNCLATFTLHCTHRRVYQNSGASTFEEGNIGPSNVVTEFIKRVKTKGATKGKWVCSTCHCITYTNLHFMISFIRINIYNFIIVSYNFFLCYFGNTNCRIFRLALGTDCMRSNTKLKISAEKKSKQRKHKMKLNQTTNARRCVTQHAASSDERCPMRIVLILSSNMQWYIHSSSSLKHHNHPPIEEEATLLSQKDLSDKDEQLINILCDADVPPSKISKIMNAVREDNKGSNNGHVCPWYSPNYHLSWGGYKIVWTKLYHNDYTK